MTLDTLTEQYKEDGFIIVRGLFNTKEIQELKDEIVAVCRGERGNVKGLEACSPNETEDDFLRKYLCFHHPHKMSDIIRDFSIKHPKIVDTLVQIVGPNVKFMQSMYFIKGPGKPGQAWHQDEIYIPTRDRSLTAAWIAIDDAKIENGCLWVLPGSHKRGVLYPNKPHNNPKFDSSGESFGFDDTKAIPVELNSGDAVFFNGYLLHRSLPNTTQANYRRALATHYMSAESLLPWTSDGRTPLEAIQGDNMQLDNRDVLMVAGEDPYSWRPLVTNNTYPYIRAEKRDGSAEHNEKQK